MKFLSFATAMAVALCCASPASANLITNGSFEEGFRPPTTGFQTLNAGNTNITGWSITAGGIDWISSAFWQAADGTRSLDMNSVVAGTIQQQFATVAGGTYKLRFAFAGNPGGPTTRPMRVVAGDLDTVVTYTMKAGASGSNMGWEYQNLVFTASSNLTSLMFQSQTGGSGGPALDDVSVVRDQKVVPEPTILALMVPAALAFRRRRH